MGWLDFVMFGPELKSSSRGTPRLLKRIANRVSKHVAKGRTHSGALSSLQYGNLACPVPCWEKHHLLGAALNTDVRKLIATLGRLSGRCRVTACVLGLLRLKIPDSLFYVSGFREVLFTHSCKRASSLRSFNDANYHCS